MERFAVIGMGRFGSRLAKLLTDAGAEVIAVDRRADLIELMRDDVARAVCMDATDEETLKNQGIDEVDTAIVGTANPQHMKANVALVENTLSIPAEVMEELHCRFDELERRSEDGIR